MLTFHEKGSIPAEFIIYDLWESMREHDRELADEVLEPTFVFMRSQTDRARLHIKELGEYLQYREKDVGKAYVEGTRKIYTAIFQKQGLTTIFFSGCCQR